jgi:hypothetical protein
VPLLKQPLHRRRRQAAAFFSKSGDTRPHWDSESRSPFLGGEQGVRSDARLRVGVARLSSWATTMGLAGDVGEYGLDCSGVRDHRSSPAWLGRNSFGNNCSPEFWSPVASRTSIGSGRCEASSPLSTKVSSPKIAPSSATLLGFCLQPLSTA